MGNKYHWYAGICAVMVYIFAVTLGGILYPGYSHISQDISQLTSTHSPIRGFMNIFFIYNILITFYGYGLYKIRNTMLSQVGALCIMLIGILGLLIAWFPINTRGTEITATGIIHIGIVSIVSLLTVLSGFMFWFGYRNTHLRLFAKISLIAGILFVLSGPIAAANVLSPYAGLFERIPIGIFLLWVLISSVIMLRRPLRKKLV